MSNDKLKMQICDALAAWIRQRPGLEFGNYGDVSSYRSEARSIARDKRDAETLLAAVRHNSAITAEMILDAAKHSFSGRLIIAQYRDKDIPITIEYCTGQYWPTEYRKAAAAVLAGALWSHMRDNMPDSNSTVTYSGRPHGALAGNIEGFTPGDWLRNRFRKEFGSKLQRRWFN